MTEEEELKIYEKNYQQSQRAQKVVSLPKKEPQLLSHSLRTMSPSSSALPLSALSTKRTSSREIAEKTNIIPEFDHDLQLALENSSPRFSTSSNSKLILSTIGSRQESSASSSSTPPISSSSSSSSLQQREPSAEKKATLNLALRALDEKYEEELVEKLSDVSLSEAQRYGIKKRILIEKANEKKALKEQFNQ